MYFQLKYNIFRFSHFWLYCYSLQQITAYQVLAYSPSLAPLKPSLVLVLTVRGSQAKLLMWAQSAALREATHVTWCLSWFPFNACNWQTEYRAYYSSSWRAVSAFFPRRYATGLPPCNLFPFLFMLIGAWSVQRLKFTFYIYMYSPPHRACSPSFAPQMRLRRVLSVQSPAAKYNTMHLQLWVICHDFLVLKTW